MNTAQQAPIKYAHQNDGRSLGEIAYLAIHPIPYLDWREVPHPVKLAFEAISAAVHNEVERRHAPVTAEQKAYDEVMSELETASSRFPAFASPHEGYAIIKEEVDEFWTEVKANDRARAREECIQVAAMAVRFLVDFPASAVESDAWEDFISGKDQKPSGLN